MFNSNDAVSAGMVETILSADLSDEWAERIERIVDTEFGHNIDERDVLFVKWRIMQSFNNQAVGIIQRMDDDIIREFWTGKLADHKARIDEVKSALDVARVSEGTTPPAWHSDMSAYFANGGK